MSNQSRYSGHSARSDEDLLTEYLQEGDLEILAVLYQRYFHLVYGVCLKYLKDREESKDAVMQIFEKLVTDLRKHEVASFRSWLYVLTKNHCFRLLQNKTSASRKIEQFSREQIMESEPLLSPLDEPGNSFPEKALKECLERLKKEQKMSIELFYYKEKCYQEISDEMNIPLNKVKSCIQNGKRNLKICLEQHNGQGR